MTLLARATMCLTLLAFAAGCRTVVDPLAIADAQTAARVKTALVNDPDLGGRIIEVRVVLGVVELSGRVLSLAEADRAIAIARGVSGVASVRTNLQVGVEEATPDEQVEPDDVSAADLPAELQGSPGLLALGASFGWSGPRTATLKRRVALSPDNSRRSVN
ncbi:MAG: BON domain-containing protein [Gemmatimonadetes bacterium]|nr:BON domain-containing protein [Gemmatimonadota bacterium]